MIGIGRLGELFTDPGMFVLETFILIIAIAIHEFGHAIIADRNGDSLPRSEGRITLNPIAHLDPIGTIGLVIGTFGWGKPVMVSRDDWRVSAAGPAMNVLQALVYGFVFRVLVQSHTPLNPILVRLLLFGFTVNVGLALFNLIPVGPLDGASILKRFLPLHEAYKFHEFNRRYGMIIMFLLILSPAFLRILDPIQSACSNLLMMGLT